MTNFSLMVSTLKQNIARAVVGKDDVVELMLTALLCEGHVLIEDVPGVGKTTLASALARSLSCSFKRIQFTPDITPSDITGFTMPSLSGDMQYRPGAIMSQIVLADEINRTSPKTQSALLEAMEEGQVTVDGISHRIPQPFCVFATQNPTGASGTQLLPDSQMDRFTVRMSIGYPAPADERNMVLNRQGSNPLDQVRQVVRREELIAMQEQASRVYMKEEIVDYAVSLVGATRNHPLILRGASPRATLSVTAMAKAVAYIQGRDYVVPKDVQAVFVNTVAHRLLMTPEAEAKGITPDSVLEQIQSTTTAPRI